MIKYIVVFLLLISGTCFSQATIENLKKLENKRCELNTYVHFSDTTKLDDNNHLIFQFFELRKRKNDFSIKFDLSYYVEIDTVLTNVLLPESTIPGAIFGKREASFLGITLNTSRSVMFLNRNNEKEKTFVNDLFGNSDHIKLIIFLDNQIVLELDDDKKMIFDIL